MRRKPNSGIGARVAAADWQRIAAALDERGHAIIPAVLTPAECRMLASLYGCDDRFRSRVVMQRHGFGRGEYKYLNYPLPELVADLRQTLYPQLAEIAGRWQAALGGGDPYPQDLDGFLARCHAAGQKRPTPLILKYAADDYNCLHQDLYGPLVFPIQLTILLSAPETDFTGGEFMLVEQRPRAQSKGEVVPLAQGDAVAFAVHHRPQRGTRGFYRVNMRHGVSRLRSGERYTLGIIFHDAA
ncbi:MAG: uncharacterized protein QOK29_4005 [Rhodospirillaceae bacterium]|jgi:hypothetical protein|nr:uncharacterized protein [Rhodospirillaceae bacterium]